MFFDILTVTAFVERTAFLQTLEQVLLPAQTNRQLCDAFGVSQLQFQRGATPSFQHPYEKEKSGQAGENHQASLAGGL